MSGLILIIDDNYDFCELYKLLLVKTGYQVEVAYNGTTALKKLYQYNPDLILLDVMMPEMDGWETCRRIREMTNVPIIMMTAARLKGQDIRALDMGVDDYIFKPIAPAALLARIRAILRRSAELNGNSQKREIYSLGNITIDVYSHKVTKDGQRISLSPTEFKLLALLAKYRGRVLPHSFLLNEVWGLGQAEIESLRLYIRQLRHKLEQNPEDPQFIQTEWSIGYRLG